MADITYVRTFKHQDWIDNEDVVQAEGENGFNIRFHALEGDLDKVGEAVGKLSTAVSTRVSVEPIAILSKQLTPSQVTDPEDVETYSDSDVPSNHRKLYNVAIEPFGAAHGQVSYHFIYAAVAGDKTKVSIWFKNERDIPTRVTARVFGLR